MYEEIFTKLYQAVDWMVQNYNKKDKDCVIFLLPEH